jgi:hypothetical protein
MFKPLQQVLAQQKHDPPGVPLGPYLHGAFGLLNVPGTDGRVLSAMQIPVTGALENLPVVKGSRASGGLFGGEMLAYTNVLTGVTSGPADEFLNQPTESCAVGPYGGLLKMCTWANEFGRFRFSIKEIDIWKVGQHVDLADMPMRVLNNPAQGNIPFVPSGMPALTQALAGELPSRLFETLVSSVRMLHRRIWIGDSANTVGERRDFTGFDIQINVGTHFDKDARTVCTAANSDVKNFNYRLISSPNPSIVEYVENADRVVMWKARQQGLTPYDYDVYMRPDAWTVISEVWPLRQYQLFVQQMAAINAMIGTAGGVIQVSAGDLMELKQAFRDAMQLPINGKAHRVILDEGITEETPNTTPNLQPGQWASGIYGIPRTVMGALPATVLEIYDHDNAPERMVANIVSAQQGSGPTWTTDAGFFRWQSDYKNGCFQMGYEFSPRLHVLTPQLAWRIDHCAYAPLQHLSSAMPDSDYFADGGKTGTDSVKYYGWDGVQHTLQ